MHDHCSLDAGVVALPGDVVCMYLELQFKQGGGPLTYQEDREEHIRCLVDQTAFSSDANSGEWVVPGDHSTCQMG